MIEQITIHGKITSVTYDLHTENSVGPWYVASNINSDYWYIINVNTKKKKIIGKASMSGYNAYEKACDEVEARNSKETVLYSCRCGCGTKIIKLHGNLFIESLIVSREKITSCDEGFVSNKWSLKQKGLEIVKQELDKGEIK